MVSDAMQPDDPVREAQQFSGGPLVGGRLAEGSAAAVGGPYDIYSTAQGHVWCFRYQVQLDSMVGRLHI